MNELLTNINQSSPVKLVRQEMLKEILIRRRRGMTHSEIAKELNMTTNTICYHVKKYLKQLVEANKYDLEELRAEANEELKLLRGEAIKRYEGGDISFVEYAAVDLKIHERYAKMNGLDVNVNKTEMRVTNDLSTMSDEELKMRLREALNSQAESAPAVIECEEMSSVG